VGIILSLGAELPCSFALHGYSETEWRSELAAVVRVVVLDTATPHFSPLAAMAQQWP
jgi:hypothetical protein